MIPDVNDMDGPDLYEDAPNVYGDVAVERVRQDILWGEQNHAHAEWLAILHEETGEVARAVLGLRFGYCPDTPEKLLSNLREELVQVAAVAVAWIQAIDRRGP